MSINEGNKPKAESGKLKAERKKPKAESVKRKAATIHPATANSNQHTSESDSYRIEHPNPIAIGSEIKVTSESDSYRIEHPKSEIPPMEVHHHPQLEHGPKPIKEYLLEGFMIFIAVMMGFIAENVREVIDNNQQVKHLTSQLVQDLKADISQLDTVSRGETRIVKYNDTLFDLLQQPLAKADTRRIQKMVANSHSMWIFHPSAGAIAAIKNELHLKQFSNSEIIGYFATYERHIELLHTDQEINLQYQRTYLEPFSTQHITAANLLAAFNNPGEPTAQMRNLTQADLDQLATDMVLIRIITREMVTDAGLVKQDAENLLRYVKQQYHPKE